MGSRELKTRLGTYLRRVRAGETLIVTDRGRPIAELKPVHLPGETELQARIRRMVVEGRIQEGRESGLRPFQPVASLEPANSLSEAVIEGRDERL